MSRITAEKIRSLAYKLSDNGRCWWIERYIKNAYHNKFSYEPKGEDSNGYKNNYGT